jgi:hypothetical protein
MPWRAEDEVLLGRLEDERLLERLFALLTSEVGKSRTPPTSPLPSRPVLPPRAAGLIGEIRRVRGGGEAAEAALGGEVARLASFVDVLPMVGCPPALLHHLAVFHARAASFLEPSQPEAAANAWVRSLAAWLALAEERSYLGALEDSVLGTDARARGGVGDARIPPERVPSEWLATIARRAEETARDLAPPGRAALLALSRTDEAARIAGVPDLVARRARAEAERHKNAVVEGALATIGDALDEAGVRGELLTSGGTLLARAVAVWAWTSRDAMVEHFVVERVDRIGWDLYRARRWDDLRALLQPFRPIFESLAARIEADPTQIAYAAGCAQMFVFMAEVEAVLSRKLQSAERALVICPTHRNGRLVLAAALCEEALEGMRSMTLLTRQGELDRIEALVARAESLYPQTTALQEARAMLERVKKGRIYR